MKDRLSVFGSRRWPSLRGGRTWVLAVALVAVLGACGTGDEAPAGNESPDAADTDAGTGTQTEEQQTAEEAQPTGSGELIRVGFAPSTYDFTDFFGQFDAGLREGLAEHGLRYDIFVSAAEDETRLDQQVTNIENLLTLGLDYLVSVPTRVEPHYDGYRRANELGVPVVIGQFVTPIPEEEGIDILGYSGSSLENAGEVAANYIIESIGEGGRIIILRGEAGTEVDEGRVGHAIPILEDAGIEVVASEHADWDRVLAYDQTQQMLTAHDDIDLVYGGSSAMALGAMTAVEDMGLDTPVIGVGGILEEVQMVLEGRLAATIFRDPAAMGRGAAEAIWLHATGRADEIEFVQEFDNIVLDSCEDVVEHYNPLLFEVAELEWPTCD